MYACVCVHFEGWVGFSAILNDALCWQTHIKYSQKVNLSTNFIF